MGRREGNGECNIGISAGYCSIVGMCGLKSKFGIPNDDTTDDWKTNIDKMNLSGKAKRG